MSQTDPSLDGLWPDGVTFRMVQAGGIRLHVAEAGPADGHPLILLHGFPESARGWRRQVGPLTRAGFRVVMPDQRGYGASERPEGIAAYHLDRLAGDVISLADACGFRRFDLAGHDWGGLVAWWAASFHPDRVARLAILNAPHPGVVRDYLRRHPGQWLRSAYVGVFQIPALPERWMLARDAKVLRRAMVSTSRPGTFSGPEIDAYVREWRRPGALTAMLGWYRALARLPRRDAPRVRMPTLILWGRRDHALQAGLAEESLRLCDQGRVRWFPVATHWIQHEEAAAVSNALAGFFAPAGTGPGSPAAETSP